MTNERQVHRTTPAHARGNRLVVNRRSRTYAVLVGLRRAIERTIAEDLPAQSPATLLDYGCGNMPYRPLFEARGVRYLGADLPGNELADVAIAPGGRVDLPDATCNVVLSTQVLEHAVSPQAYLAECWRLLRPGGRLILSTHGYWLYHPDPTDFWRWTGDGLRRQIEEAGLRVVASRGIVGLAGSGLQLFQDGVYGRLWQPFRAPFAFLMQSLVLLFDRLHTDNDRCQESLVLVVVAEKTLGSLK